MAVREKIRPMSVTRPRPIVHGEPPVFVTSPLLGRAGLVHLFSTRHFPGIRPWRDPDGPFAPAAVTYLEQRGLAGGSVAFLRQVHGADVAVAGAGGLLGTADILMTERAALPLAIFTADCLPIVVFDPVGRRLAMAHAGWRGTVAGAARVTAEALVRAGGDPSAFIAAIGPSIGPCCYEVDAPVVEPLAAAFPESWRSWVTPAEPGRWMLDLWRANAEQLTEAGLGAERIDTLRLCTACRADLFYSYRRGRGQGRLVAIAAIPDGLRAAC
jgi:YfiH family protein